MAPHKAKGRAKMECSHLIISRVTRRLWRTGTGVGYQFCDFEIFRGGFSRIYSDKVKSLNTGDTGVHRVDRSAHAVD
jgi:hypothetical protein